jgi:hypothetical protein
LIRSSPAAIIRAVSATTRLDVKLFLAVSFVCLVFAAYTGHAWEDYWITYRASRNLATGHGLVFTPGERLQTFTSPLGVLLPAALCWLTGNRSDELVLWLFRVVSITALAAGIVLLLRLALRLQRHRLSSILTVALVALDAKTVDFTINGMETGLLVFFLALAVHGLLVSGPRQMLRIGIGWAGLMWTRPDGVVYIGALGLAALVFPPAAAGVRAGRAWWRTLLGAALVCAASYLPWVLWTWWYYGSPVPHTVVAKATNRPALSPLAVVEDFLLFPVQLLVGDSSVAWTYLPHYAWFGGWVDTLHAAARVCGLAAAFAWLVPVLRPQTRLLSLACYLVQFYLSAVLRAYFPWYLPAGAVLGYLTLGMLFDQALSLASMLPRLGWDRGWFRHLPLALRGAAIVLVAGQAAVTVCVARQMQVQQTLIEDGMRRQIGMWLHDHARSPRDTVLLEPLGYIGYFSDLKMLDFAGLSSTEMVETRRRLGAEKESQAYLELRPDWLVLRPAEARPGGIVDPARLAELYDVVQVFDTADKVRAVRWLPGRGYLEFDQKFVVLRRKADGVPSPAR